MIIIKNIINIIQIIKFIPSRLVWLGLLWKKRFRMIKTFPKFRPIFVSICLRAFCCIPCAPITGSHTQMRSSAVFPSVSSSCFVGFFPRYRFMNMNCVGSNTPT